MKLFKASNRTWLSMPTGLLPFKGFVRVLVKEDIPGRRKLGRRMRVSHSTFEQDKGDLEGWYPLKDYGPDDHETAAKFITFTPRPSRPRQIRRRFKLSTKRSILP